MEFEEIMKSNNQDFIQENANVDGMSPMSHMMQFASTSSKHYTMEHLLSKEVKTAFEEGYIHIHDLDFFSSGTTTCCQIPLGKVLADGFNTGHGFMREPNSIMSAMALTSIILQANQNQQHGGQAIPMLDYDLAPYIQKSFTNNKKKLEEIIKDANVLEQKAWEWTEKETYQACEAFIHNCNSMHSRGGNQTPFVSVNLGTDTSVEGRMLTRNLLLATKAGLGRGETPIFPIIVFKVKDGINYEKNDPNYDLFRLGLETTSKRLFPNFVFIDAPFNLAYYNGTPESEVATMGCRTRIMGNLHGKEQTIGRGNLSFTSINLPLLALESTTIEDFYEKLTTNIDLVVKQLFERFMYQGSKRGANFKFLYTQGVWNGGDKLAIETPLKDILKQGTLSIGYVGLAEALVALLGVHHGESKKAYEIGLEIVRFMRQKADEAAEQYQLNYSLIATPAESFAGKALRTTKKRFGVIKGVTDREYFTNSFHIPVYYPISIYEKIKKEAPFHELCNAGHITYVELDGDASKNVDAIETIVRTMKESGIGYGSINHPVDRCLSCQHKGIINKQCPNCGEEDEKQIERIRRITGYLVGSLDRWNTAKQAEEKERVKHR
ncbi:anaerobic ribonucleoside triphosphate reductase [Bacillus sp. B1-b2]|uniref:anaerobic ribonucleoside triphosphate reductase n=1 Tax=Bacillus sp. B1-b2 TaxID=2653201 RepID=UPI001262506B|nr:anaerobic ribonucleoside triphosphate reductase [Bacillus sp. B1-b2]KAB7667645.1 anaerobic ribonucleoside triphosphate reductase [Bacillus sp. B1-b2]